MDCRWSCKRRKRGSLLRDASKVHQFKKGTSKVHQFQKGASKVHRFKGEARDCSSGALEGKGFQLCEMHKVALYGVDVL